MVISGWTPPLEIFTNAFNWDSTALSSPWVVNLKVITFFELGNVKSCSLIPLVNFLKSIFLGSKEVKSTDSILVSPLTGSVYSNS